MSQITVTKKLGEDILIVDEEGSQPPPTGDCKCDVRAGNTTTVAPGTPAKVTDRKEGDITYLDFEIPKGEKGDKGDPGTSSGGGTGGISLGRGYADVTNFGARGDGSNDDAPAFTNAWNSIRSTGGDLYAPTPSNFYNFKSTFHAKPDGNQVWINFRMGGTRIQKGIIYTGPSNNPAINAVGLKNCRWENIRAYVANDISGVQLIDFHSEGSANSLTGVNVCNAYLGLGNKANQGMRFDKLQGGNGDISLFNFDNCTIYGNRTPGQHAYQSQGPNVLAMNVYGGFAAQCDSIFSNWGDNDGDRGGACWYFYGVHSSGNLCNYYVDREGTFVIDGGRYEADDMFLKTTSGSSNVAIEVIGARMNDMKGPTLFEMNKSFALKISSCHMHKSSPEFTQLLKVSNDQLSTLIIDGGASRYTNLITRTGGGQKCKTYLRGHAKFTNDGTARYIETHYPDINGQML